MEKGAETLVGINVEQTGVFFLGLKGDEPMNNFCHFRFIVMVGTILNVSLKTVVAQIKELNVHCPERVVLLGDRSSK